MGHAKTIVCFGPGPSFKGGLSDYNVSLAKALEKNVERVYIVSWTQQYPNIIPRDFKDNVSREDHLQGTEIELKYITNYNNPFTWFKTAKFIADLKPDMVIFQWSIAVQGLPIGRIINAIKRKIDCEIIVDLHFVLQKEKSKIDRSFTKMGIANADTYIVHAYKTANELQALFPSQGFYITETGERKWQKDQKPIIKLYHPIYNLFEPDPQFNLQAFKEEHGLKENVFLFFGFIRKYKGLHNVIRAFKHVAQERDDVTLLICGESFWNTLDTQRLGAKLKKLIFGIAKKLFLGKEDDEGDYRPLDLIQQLDLDSNVVLFNQFIPNEEVHKYFQVSDCVVLYYLTATPSGIESLSYNFGQPVLATRVGHFPETIKEGYNGYLAEPNDIESMAQTMNLFLEKPLDRENVKKVAADMSWDNYAEAILRQEEMSANTNLD